MTVLSITAANVVKGADAVVEHGYAGATITAGMAVFKAAATGLFGISDADHATAENRNVYGIALNGASANQPLAVQRAGSITIGATVVVGEIYVLDTSPGGIAPRADLGVGEYTSVIGVATTAAIIKLGITSGAVALAS